MLFMPKAQEYAEKLKWAKEQIDAIRTDIAHIRSQMNDVVHILKQPIEQQSLSRVTDTNKWENSL